MKLYLSAVVATLALQPAFAAQPQPSEKSVLQLFQVMHTHQLLDNAAAQMNDNMRSTMKEVTRGQPLNAEQQKIREETQGKVIAIMKEALDWSSFEPLMVEAYRSTFTQEEVDAMLKFYGSPVGQSIGAKLPAASQQMMQLMHQRIQEMIPRIIAVQKDAATRIKAAASPGANLGAEPAQPGEPPSH
jgi:hypothetical protein